MGARIDCGRGGGARGGADDASLGETIVDSAIFMWHHIADSHTHVGSVPAGPSHAIKGTTPDDEYT